MSDTKSIVVIGGGYSGIAFAQAAAKQLSSSNVQVTVIEKRKFQFHVIGALRACVDESFTPNLFIPYDNAFDGIDNATLKHGHVKSINYSSKEIMFQAGGDEEKSTDTNIIKYDYLVLATGSTYPAPIQPETNNQDELIESYRETAQKIKNCESILIIGGGAVGVEMAGEIKSFHPNKKVTLLDRNDGLFSSQNVPKMRKPAKDTLEAMGVEVVLGEDLTESVTSTEFVKKTLTTTKSGKVIESDAQILCFGMTPNISLMTDKSCLDGRFISVKQSMEVDNPGYENVFVIGDASNHPTPKMGYWGMEQGKFLATSIADNIQNGNTFQPYDEPATEALFVPIGPNGGVSQLPICGGFVAGNFFTRMVKSKDLLSGMLFGALNAKVPN